MGGSAPEAPTLPDAQSVSGVRASDAERDEVVAKLTEEFAAGRLSQDTFLFRMSAVLEARHQADLPPLLADLPSAAAAPVSGSPALVPPGPPAPGSPAPGSPAAAPAAPGPPASGSPAAAPAAPLPPPLPSATAVPGPGAVGGPRPAGRQSSLVSRLRGALPRRIWAAPTQAGDAPSLGPSHGSSPVRRLTSGMLRAAAETRGPVPLQFPRGDGTQFSIGRDASCDLAIADMTVSRVHARLERTEDGWLLTDLASTNGTRVNGWLVRGRVQVQAGDLVSFGNAEYSLGAADGS